MINAAHGGEDHRVHVALLPQVHVGSMEMVCRAGFNAITRPVASWHPAISAHRRVDPSAPPRALSPERRRLGRPRGDKKQALSDGTGADLGQGIPMPLCTEPAAHTGAPGVK